MLRRVFTFGLMWILFLPAAGKEWKGIVVHHSATESGTIEAFRRYHVETLKFKDIGYHYVIYRDGSVHQGRPLNMNGAHARGRNSTHIGICLVGNHLFTKEQLESLKELVDKIGLPAEGHHEECPGPQMDFEWLNKRR